MPLFRSDADDRGFNRHRIVGYAITKDRKISTVLGIGGLASFGAMWIVFPQLIKRFPVKPD